MEYLNSKHCPKCGEVVMPMAAFCQACGEGLPSNTSSASAASKATNQPGDKAAPVLEFRKLRVMNWSIATLISVGAVLMLLRANSSMGILLVAALMSFLLIRHNEE